MKTSVKILVSIFSAIIILVLFAVLKVELHNQVINISTSGIGNGVISILFFFLFVTQKKNVKKEKNYNNIILKKPNNANENPKVFKKYNIKFKTLIIFYLSIIIIFCILVFLKQ
jgi:hypothetical protein